MIRIGAPLREGADRRRYARRRGDVHAAADQRLDRFRPGLGIENFQLEPVLLEDAAALAEFGHACIPGTALRDHYLKHVLRRSLSAGEAGQDKRANRSNDRSCSGHFRSSLVHS